jgi:hypothetical protein
VLGGRGECVTAGEADPARSTGAVPPTTLMAHIVPVVGDGNGDGTTWLESVTDEQYAAANA